ncbi:hypothetical protein ACIRO3_06400 [Streptomyces sp. NPDC102278]|uniref:hypothetical protein n=1 Tax=Streptomyces sp. NPDC102278 TaxID=3366152 RepID=UPI0038030106
MADTVPRARIGGAIMTASPRAVATGVRFTFAVGAALILCALVLAAGSGFLARAFPSGTTGTDTPDVPGAPPGRAATGAGRTRP